MGALMAGILYLDQNVHISQDGIAKYRKYVGPRWLLQILLETLICNDNVLINCNNKLINIVLNNMKTDKEPIKREYNVLISQSRRKVQHHGGKSMLDIQSYYRSNE